MVMIARPDSSLRSSNLQDAAATEPGVLGCFQRRLAGNPGVNCIHMSPYGDMIITAGSTQTARQSGSMAAQEAGWLQMWEEARGSPGWVLLGTLDTGGRRPAGAALQTEMPLPFLSTYSASFTSYSPATNKHHKGLPPGSSPFRSFASLRSNAAAGKSRAASDSHGLHWAGNEGAEEVAMGISVDIKSEWEELIGDRMPPVTAITSHAQIMISATGHGNLTNSSMGGPCLVSASTPCQNCSFVARVQDIWSATHTPIYFCATDLPLLPHPR